MMNRRTFLREVAIVTAATSSLPLTPPLVAEAQRGAVDPVGAALRSDWLARWEKEYPG